MKAAGRCGRIGSSPKIIDRGTDSVLLAAVARVVTIGTEKGKFTGHSLKIIGRNLTLIEKERTVRILCLF